MQPVAWTQAPRKSFATAPFPLKGAAFVTCVQIVIGVVLATAFFGEIGEVADSVGGPGAGGSFGDVRVGAALLGALFSTVVFALLYGFAFAGKRVAHVLLLVLAGIAIVGALLGLGGRAGNGVFAGTDLGAISKLSSLVSLLTASAEFYLLTRPDVVAYVKPAPANAPTPAPPYAP